jgi:hypothetical protein
MTESIPTFTIELYKENGRYTKILTAPDGSRPDPVDFELTGYEAHSSVLRRFQATRDSDPIELQHLGEWLYSLLFNGETEGWYREYLGKNQKRMGLRLIIGAEELDRLPWEMMYDRSRRNWLATLSDRPLTRTIVRRRPPPPVREANSPLKALIVSASPPPLPRQPVNQVLQGLEHHLADLQREGKIVTKPLEEATLDTITRAMEEQFDVVLFVGHGEAGNEGASAGIFLHDELNHQSKRRVSAADLGRRVNDKLPRMVFLAACQSNASTQDGGIGFARALVTETDIPVVVAMQTFIEGGNAGDLAGWFLRNAAQGESVDVALAIARETLMRGNALPSADVFSGVMYLQASNADVFELSRTADAHPVPMQDTRSETSGDTVVTGTYTIRQESGSFKVSWKFSVTKNSRSGTGKGSMSLRLLDANGREISEATRTLTVGANPLRPSSMKEASEENLISQMPANVLFDVNAESDTSGIS